MLTLAIALGSFVLYLIAYHTYGRWLSRKFFKLDPAAPVPSREVNDGHDYVPTRKEILFGHHFTSIAGTGPIVGPALAVIWGWLPALLWVLFGSIFLGAVHDLATLVVSIRNRGQTIGEIAGRLINPRVKILFLLLLFMALTIVLAIFGLVIANIFAMYSSSVLAVWIAMPVAVGVGWLVYKRGWKPQGPALLSLFITVIAIILAGEFASFDFVIKPINLGGYTISPIVTWTLFLFVYCYLASVMPVWLLLQPRDYINSYLLVLGLVLLVGGIGAATFLTPGGVPMVAPAVNLNVPDAPPIMPFLFVTIACGAISGFHCLVSSGTSSKQIACETDAQFVGYGSMLTEGFLAVLVILACCAGLGINSNVASSQFYAISGAVPAGFGANPFQFDRSKVDMKGMKYVTADVAVGDPSQPMQFEAFRSPSGKTVALLLKSNGAVIERNEKMQLSTGNIAIDGDGEIYFTQSLAWKQRYSSWTVSGGLAKTVSAFVDGSGNFITAMGIPRPVALALMAVLVASFAATTLDTATRLQRYVIQELAGTFNVAPLKGKHGATLFAVGTAAILAAVPPPGETWATGMGKGGLTLWPVFGAVNQLLAGLAFMVVAFYLARRKMPTWFITIPAVLMLVVPLSATLYQLLNRTNGWWPKGQYHLVAAGIVICLLQIWMVAEGLRLWPKVRGVLEQPLPPVPRGFPVTPVV